MSDAAAKTNQPTSGPVHPAPHRRGISVFLWWFFILLISIGAFAAAVVYSGGVNGALDVLSSVDAHKLLAAIPFLHEQAAPQASAPATSSVAATSTASQTETAPPAPERAETLMYKEQLRSQAALGAMAQGHVDAISLGTAQIGSETATIPVSASYAGAGTVFHGTMVLRKYGDMWYFDGLRDNGKTPDTDAADVAVDPNVVQTLTDQQGLPENQRMLTDGVLGGGFKTASIEKVVRGAGTTTVYARLSGGNWVTGFGRFVIITKPVGSSTYYFLARLDEQ